MIGHRDVRPLADDDAAILCRFAAAPGDPPHRPATAAIARQPLGAATAFAVESVTVRAAGREQRFFLKRFERSQLPGEDLRQRGLREIAVYRHLLADGALGTARYRGSLAEGDGGRCWLALEFVDGTPLDTAPFDHWLLAAGWLGCLQSCQPDGEAGALLQRHDAGFFRRTIDTAVHEVAAAAPAAGARLRAVAAALDPVVDLWQRQPCTLVHGSFRPQHILVDATARPPRICPIDWEHAALGSPLYDLAFLSANRGVAQTAQLMTAYRDAAARHGVALPPAGEALLVLQSLQLFKLLRSLTRAHSWSYPPATVQKLVDLTEEARRELAI